MTLTLERPTLKAQKRELDLSPEHFGELRRSMDVIDDADVLRARMAEDGYLYLPGYLIRDEVIEARRACLRKMADAGMLDQDKPLMDAYPNTVDPSYFMPGLANDNPPLMKLLYEGPMMAFYEHLLGGEVRHYDYTWMRTVSPGGGTQPHCDIVYMGRGTTNLYTSWVPLGDIPRSMGGLIVLEGSHKIDRLKENYGRKDVDEWCENRRPAPTDGPGGDGNIGWGGALSPDAVRLRERLGGRWLTADFEAGDLLVFCMYLVHASLDNGSDRFRLSSDSRYQLASEPVDERWIGENPPAHGQAAKRGRIC
jgi:hypothetical protein